MSVEKFDNSYHAMTHCRECGAELTEEAWKHLKSLLDNTENVLNFESKVRKTSGNFSKMIEI